MANIDLEPVRLVPSAPVRRCQLPVKEKIFLDEPKEISATFAAALRARRSAEKLGAISPENLSTWLYYVASIQAVQEFDRNRQRRFVGSFGALHPAHILLGTPEQRWFAYLPGEHSLGELSVHPDISTALRTKAMEFYRAEEATIVGLLCDLDLVSSYYGNASDLVMRDAGVLLGHAALVASSIQISFRILGATGTGLIEQLVSNLPFAPLAVGMALVGARSA
jgi:hypothetical protein